MGRTHSAAYKSVNNIFGDEVVPELVVVADVNEENAKAVAEKYGYQRWTTDWHEIMNDPAIDLVDITTPNASHCPIAIQAAKHGKQDVYKRQHLICFLRCGVGFAGDCV